MAVTLRASAKPGAPTVANTLSAGYGGRLLLTISGVTDLEGVYVVVGVDNPGPPATYADLTPVQQFPMLTLSGPISIGWQAVPGLYNVSLSVLLGADDISAEDQVYVAVFIGSGATPGPTDAPDAVAGPFVGVR